MDLKLKIKPLDIEVGGEYVAVLNEGWADQKGIIAGDRIKIMKGDKELVAITDTSDRSIKRGEIGIFEEIEREYGFETGEIVEIKRIERPESPAFIKEKLDGKKLNYEKLKTIVEDIVHNKLSKTEISAFAVATYTRDFSMEETANLTRAVIETGEQLTWDRSPIANKHCLGGVPGNRTTMIIVPIIAAAGVMIPKTSSRAITSPAGTADTMELLANVTFQASELQDIVKQTHGCMAWGGGIDIAPADSELVKVLNPLRLDPVPLTLTSIMAKKRASGTTHLLLDIPVGRRSKVEKRREGKQLKRKFKRIGNILDMNTKVVLTNGSEPIGNGIGPLLEAKDVLKVLERRSSRPIDLEEKSLTLAGELLDLVGFEQGHEKAKQLLESKKALEKFKEIVTAQNGDPNLTSKDLEPAKHTMEIRAEKSGEITHIDNIYITEVARRLGCPGLKKSGVYLHEHIGAKVEKDTSLLSLYARNESSLEEANRYIQEHHPFKIE